MSLALTTRRLELLKKRAEALKNVRSFFDEAKVLEVDTPTIVSLPPIDQFIDLMEVQTKKEKRYLASSPEYLMKRLLAEGMKDIYQLSYVYRDDEFGPNHNPAFTMVEWYRVGWSLDALIEETLQLISLFITVEKPVILSYQEAFYQATQLDPKTASLDELKKCLSSTTNLDTYSRLELLDLIYVSKVEPNFPDSLFVLKGFLPEQAALSTVANGMAERFEIYYRRIELANGYNELSDPNELRARFEKANLARKKPLPIDERFLASQANMPPCVGVALGFDRLLMLCCQVDNLQEILPFDWSNS